MGLLGRGMMTHHLHHSGRLALLIEFTSFLVSLVLLDQLKTIGNESLHYEGSNYVHWASRFRFLIWGD